MISNLGLKGLTFRLGFKGFTFNLGLTGLILNLVKNIQLRTQGNNV